MASRTLEDPLAVERGSLPLDIDDVHILLQVEQEQIQKRTFTNWVNAQLSKRRPPVAVLDLFNDFRDGSRLLDLLEVMCSQNMSREKSRGVFQHRTNIEKALAFLRGKSIKLVNINVSDIMDGKPSIILGLIWTIIMHFHIEELANTLSFSSRQSSMESLASLDTRSTSSSARSSPVPPHGSPLHTRFKISAKKALLLWVREQCHKAGCTLNVKDFKTSWRSGVVFLAVLCALRPDVVNLSKARTRSNRQNLEEAFHIAEKELHIPRLLDPADVDVRDPDEKSIMTYVAQFLQYTKDTPSSGEDIQVEYLTPPSSISSVDLPCNFTPAVAASPFRQTSATQKAQEVTCWLEQAYQELLEGWESTEGESYAERYHVFQTFLVSFNEQRRPVMPLLTAMKRTVKLSEEQRALRHAWDSLAEKLREYKTELDLSLPCPLDTVGHWLLRAEKALADGDDNRQDHATAAQEAREKQDLFKLCLEEMPHHMKTFQLFQNTDEYGEMVVPSDKMEEIKRRFTSVRVSAKYHGIRLEYQEHRHTVLDLLTQLTSKLHTWKRGYISPEAVRVLLKDWNETVNKLGLPSMLEGTLSKLRDNANKYTSKSALAGDSTRVSNQMKDLEAKTSQTLEEVKMVKGTIARTLTAWDTYSDTYTSLHAWLEQGTQTNRHEQQAEVTMELMSEWSSHRERLNEVGNYLMDVTDLETSRSISDDLCRINLMWADFVRRTQFELVEEQSVTPIRPQTLQGLIREAKQLLKEPVDVLSESLQTFRKRLRFMMKKIQDIDLDSLCPSLECSAETLRKLKQAIPEVLQTLDEAMQVCEELQQSVSSLNGRLAELIHWESEVKEFYELLKEKSRRHQRAQDFRTRSLISRGLQLEGQVVMEEQDLQEMVMLRQKNSPLQYLIASTMQDRVRAAVAQSQEVVGMLSSIGIQEQVVTKPEPEPQTVPVIIVQEYQEDKSQIQAVEPPQFRKESLENLSVQSKPEAHAQDILPKFESKSNLVDAVSSRTLISGDTNETMKSQPTHQDHKQKQEQIEQAPTIQHFQTLRQETTQPRMQTDSLQPIQSQQHQVQMHKQVTSQQQIFFQQSTKVRKSQKCLENRPWLQQKAQAEGKQSSDVLPQPKEIDTAQAPVTKTGPVQAQSRVTLTGTNSIPQVPTTDANRVQDKKITQTQAQVTQVQPSALTTFHHTVPATDSSHLKPKSFIQGTQIQKQKADTQIAQTPVDQCQQRQAVPQIQLGQVNQQHPVSQMVAKEQVPALSPVNLQKQPQALSVQQHPQPYTATTFTQPPKKQSEMQPPGMTRMQQPFMGQTQSSIMDKHQTKIHPLTQMQPQIIAQRQPDIVASQSLVKQAITLNQSQGFIATPAKPKITAPVEPRIITMPQCQTQFCRSPQAPPQVMSINKTYDNIQLRPQPNNQEPQWRPSMPELMTQSYNEAPQQGFMPSNMPPQVHFQSYSQSQGITQTQAQPQQWGALSGGLASQTYPNIHGSGHMHPNNQFQVYPSHQPQSQQWGQFQFEPTMQPYSQTPVQSFVPPQHWQPVKQSSIVSHSYQMSKYPQVQQQVTQRPQSPSQEWSIQPKTESKSKFLNMVPQPVANMPWAQPSSQSPVRTQGPAPQQSYSQQQQWTKNKSEVSFQVQSQTLQSLPQNQVFQKLQSPDREQPQHQSVTQVKPFNAGLDVRQSTILQHPPTQQQQSSQFRAQPPLHIQTQTHTIYTEPHQKVFQRPQLLEQEQSRQQALAQSSILGPIGPQGPTSQLPLDQQQQWPQYRAEAPFQLQVQSQTLQPLSQLEMLQPPLLPVQEKVQQHSLSQVKPPAQVQAPLQASPEDYKNAEALAKNTFEDAKHLLQEHVLEACNISQGKKVPQEQIPFKEETLDPELLKEFLKAAQGMEHFCTTSQRQDMELFTLSIRNQWEACSSSSLGQSEQQLEALQQLYHILSPEDANRLAQAQPQECKSTFPAIQRQSSGDQDVTPTDSGVIAERSKETSSQKPALPETPVEITTETSPVTAQQPKTVEKKEILKQTSTEEDRYRSSRFALQAQLNRNEQYMLGDRLSGSATVTDLQRRLRELKALQDETETLWTEYEVQCSQCSQISERAMEQDRTELTVMWKEQSMQLQRRVDSLGAALELMDSIQQHIAEISECLNQFIKEPKDVNEYTLINPNILKDIKDLDERIQMQIDRLSRFDSEPSHLDLRDRSPLTQLVLKHRSSLDCLRQQVRKSDAAVRALDRFLVSLHTLDQDVLVVQSAPCADMMALQDSKSKLTLSRKGAASLSEKAPQLDQLLGGAQITVTQKGSSVTCLDMVAGLVRKVEDTDDKLIIRQEELQHEQQSKGLRMREKTLLAELKKLQSVAEKQSLTEPTIPAVQHRIRALSDLQTQINSLRPEYESFRETASKRSTNTEQCNEMEIVWMETERAVADRQEHCSNLMELLKKFQSCRSALGNILQRAEQTITEHASYMGKDNLQRLIARVCGIKEDLNSLGPKIEEFRAVCRQLRFHLKKLPDCSETPFEAEADALVDSWLDISEKTDSYMDSLRMGLELWEKQLMLGEELEVWTSAKLNHFAESHPFSCENEVLEMKDEIQTQDQSLEQFSRKSLEIQELLQSKEAPLELQVMETALKKKMGQVKELFDSCTKVFQELLSVRAHLLQRIDTCQTDIQRIHSLLRTLCADNRDLLQQNLQDLSDQLLDQEEEADSLINEVELMSSVTSPQALEELSYKSKCLKDNIAVTRELIGRKKEQGEKSVLVQSIKDECQMFEDWLQDAQLAVNECFENPELKEDVEASMQRLEDFLASEEGDLRLAQVKKALEKKGQEEVPAETHAELCAWRQEQEGELNTLRAHCQGRHKQLKDILIKLKSLQEEHDHFRDWLGQKETLPKQREKLRQVHDDFLKESGRIEAFSDLLALVRLKGLRGDPVLRDSESLVDQYHSLGICLENQSEAYKTLEKEVEIFHVKEENTRIWARDLKQSLESLDKDSLTAEELLKIQSVVDLSDEGDSKMVALRKDGESLCAREELEESKRQEILWSLRKAGDEWRRVLDLAQQLKAKAELEQTLLKEVEALHDEEKNTWSWVNEQMQKLDFVDKEMQIQERTNKLQEILSLKHEGDLKLSALRQKREHICAHKESKRHSIERSPSELEEKWEKVLQTAQEIKSQIEHEDYLDKNVQSFQDQMENTQGWIKKMKLTLQSIDKSSPAEEIITQAQTLLVQGPDGDSKLAALRHAGEFLCTCEGLKETTSSSVQQTQKALEQEWKAVIDSARILKNNAEVQTALDEEFKDFQLQEEIFLAWILELQQPFESLEKTLVPINEILVISQTVLNLQQEADLKMAALKSKGENLYAKLDESRKQSIQETLCYVQEKLKRLIEIARKHKNQAELQDSLSTELQTYLSEERKILSWVEELKQELGSLGKSVHGTQEQIEERLNKAQAVLSLRAEGNCQMSSLKRKAEGLCSREDLDEQTRSTLVQNLKSLEDEYKGVFQSAQELHSLLRSVVERLVSCQCQRQQTQSRVEQLKQQMAALPRHFPWPGLGERRHTVEQALALLDKARSLTPTLSALRALGREMSQLTRDPSWTDPSWAAMEECVSGLIKDLKELCESLQDGICTERNCIQLLEQRSAAQDWLREQVKGFGPLPSDRHELQGFVNTLKALLQTMEREESEIRELDLAKDALINLCTPGGRDGLTLEIAHLHDLCATAKKEITDRLVVCETRLADIDLKIAERRESFTAQAESILNDLRAQECQGLMEGNRNISQLKENWNILKSCEMELKKIEAKVCNLGQAVGNVPPDEALPYNIISLVDTVTQQYCRLQSKLSEWNNDCADAAVRCMRDALQVLRSWTQSTQKPSSDSLCTIQAMIEEGAALHKNLQEAVSDQQLLIDCLGQELATKLEKDASNALKDADIIIVQLQQRLQDLEEESLKNKDFTAALETETSHVASEVSCDWPSKLDTSKNLILDCPKPEDISSAPVTSSKDLSVETFEVYKDSAVSIIKETLAKSEQPPETSIGDVLLVNNQSDDTSSTGAELKSGIPEFLMTVNEKLPESSTAEPMLVSAVEESEVEFKTDDLSTTTPTTTFTLKETAEMIGSASLPHCVLESFTESKKTSEEQELSVSTVTVEDLSEDVDFSTADWSLTALHFDQSDIKTDSLSTMTLDVQSEKNDVYAMGPAESKDFDSELIATEELHDIKTTIKERPVESVESKGLFTSETGELMDEENKLPKKRIASLILDTDTVYIQTTEVPNVLEPSKPGDSLTDVSEHNVMLNVEQQNSETLEFIDTLPAPPAQVSANKETAHQQLELERISKTVDIEEHIIKPTPPVRRKVSDSTSCVSKTPKIEEKSPMIEKDSKSLTVQVSDSSGLEMPRTIVVEESIEKTSLPGDLQVKPTPPTRRKTTTQEKSFEVPLINLTPPVRQKVSSQIDSDTLSMPTESQEIGNLENFTLVEPVKAGDEILVKPTPPVRRKALSRTNSNTSIVSETKDVAENLVKPTPPTRRRDNRRVSDLVPIELEKYLEEALIKPTPPVRRKGLSRTTSNISIFDKATEMEETLVKPTPPTRRRDNRRSSDVVPIELEKYLEEAFIKPTPPVRRKGLSRTTSNISIFDKTTETEETLVKPTPPTRRKDSRRVSDLVPIDLEKYLEEAFIRPTPPVRGKGLSRTTSNISIFDKTTEMEETLVKPTPPTRRKDSRRVSDVVPIGLEKSLEEVVIEPTPPVRRKTTPSEIDIFMVSKTPEIEETSVKPTPPTRRKEHRHVIDTEVGKISSSDDLKNVAEELNVKQTTSVSEATEIGSLIIKPQKVDDTLVISTPSISGSDFMASKISVSNDLEYTVTRDTATEEDLVKPSPPEKPTLLTDSKDSRNTDVIVPEQEESEFPVSTDLDKTNLPEEHDMGSHVIPFSLVLHSESEIAKTQEVEQIPEEPTERKDETVPQQMESEITSRTDFDKTLGLEIAKEGELVEQTFQVGQEASQAKSDIGIVEKTQEREEKAEKPTGDSKNMDETLHKQMENKIPCTDLDKKSADEEDINKRSSIIGQKTTSLTIVGDSINVEETKPKQVEGEVYSSVEIDQTVRQDNTVGQTASPAERDMMMPTPSESKSDTVNEVSQSDLQGGIIETSLGEIDHESIKTSSVSTESEKALLQPITPTDQEEDTITTDAILGNVEEPSAQPISTPEDTNNSAEIQPIVQQDVKQSEPEHCSALAVEPTEVLNKSESISLVEAQENDASKSKLAKDVDTFEVMEVEEEEGPLGSTMNIIFSEIEKMSKTRPNSILIESRPYEDPLDLLKPSDVDHEAQLNRLAFCILCCRNSPAALNPTDMAKQVEEAEFCRQRAQEQVALISKQDSVNGDFSSLATSSAIDPEAMQRLSCQWTEALWEASGTVHTKEAQLQLVIDYDRQLQKAKAAIEKMAGELESLKMCPVESSFVEEQRLRSFLRTMDQERMVIGELIQTHSELSPHLSQPERAAAILQQNVLQCEWKTLERTAEKSLHNVSTYTKESFDLLEDINTLKDHLENFHQLLGSHWDSFANWDSKRTQEMIRLSAELKAAKHRYSDLHQRSEDFFQSCHFHVEVYNIQHGIWSVKDHIDLIDEDLAFSFPTSDSPNMVKIVKETTEALAWAKKTEYDLENRQRRVSLFPEEVHRQIKDLKKLNLEVTSKQKQLTTLIEEFTQMIPDLDKADVPLLTYSLDLLASLSESAVKRLAAAMEEIQLSLQTREKISEQIADVESWILAHLHKKSLSQEDFLSLNALDLGRSLEQSQNTLLEAEKHSGITEALLMKSKDISSELSISENALLYEKLTKLQEDIKGIINYEKSSNLEITDILQTQESSEQKMTLLEQKLEQIMMDMKGHTFPVTKNSLCAVEPFKRMLVDHKFQLEKINTSAEGKRKELLGVISELHHKIRAFYNKSEIHERFLSHKQCVEDLLDNIESYVPKMNDEKISKEERYKICQSLLTQISLIKLMYKDVSDELANISQDLHPSQRTTEQERLKQNADSLNNWEMAIQSNLQIVERDILEGIDYLSEQRVVHCFLKEVNQVLVKTYELEFNQGAIENELRKFLKLQKIIEARMRVLEVMEIKNEHQQRSQRSKDIADLAKSALEKCDQRLVDLYNAQESLKNYSTRVKSANQFLQRTESILLPSLCSPRSCSEKLKDVQQALLSSDKDFKSHLTGIQSLAPFSPVFSAQKTEQLKLEIQGCLLVRMSTLKAQAQLRLEALQRCVDTQKSTRVRYEDLCQHIRDLETTLTVCASQKITSQKDCCDQQEKLKMLVKEVDILPGKLNELREWCPVHGCRSNRDDAVNSLWSQVIRLRQFARDLLAHSERREEELISIKKSVEIALIFLEQMEAELPECSMEKASSDQLQELLQFWSPYQDRLDCEHRSLSALELHVARLMRVPSHVEQAPPIPLCQELQTMQERYNRLKSQSALSFKAVQAEIEERTKVCEELQSIRKWIAIAGPVLAQLEQVPNNEHLQELHSELCSQKTVLQRIMEGLRMKYSDMYTLVPMEIDGPLQEVSNSLQEVGAQVEAIVQKSGPLHRLDAKLSEINTGLDTVQSRLRTKSLNVAEAENAHKRVWDELDSLHSHLAAVEVELQDVSEGNPEEMENLKKKLSQTQQLHTHLSKQAEDRTAFLNKIHGWLQEHEDMVKGSQSWITESESWLTAPYTYTSAKCLDSHANALQMVLDDSAQIRLTLQGFESVLQEMASVCDVTCLQQELHEADQRVADLQSSILEPLKTLEHGAAEVDSMEAELRIMEKDVIELKLALTSKQGISQDKFMAAENSIKLLKRTVDELMSCKAGLCLPEGAENTLAVFRSADLLMKKLLELEQLALEHTVVVSEPCETSSTLRVPPTIAEEEPQDSVLEQGQVEIVHLTEDVLTRSGAVLMTVQELTFEKRLDPSAHTQDIESEGTTTPADSTGSHTKEPDTQAAEGEHVGSEPPNEAEAAAEPELVTKTPFVSELSESPPPRAQLKCVVS